MAKPTAQLDLFDDVPAPVVGARGNVYVGTCSWADPSLIKCHRFYPKGCVPDQRLRFYAMPDPAHTAAWAEQTPDGFQFNIKPFRLFSGHQTQPRAFPADIQRALPPLSGRKKNFYYQERELGVVHVVVDEPQQVGNFAHEVWATANPALAIVRLHGRNAETWRGKGLSASAERFNYEYQDLELAEIAARIERLSPSTVDNHVGAR